MNAQTERSRLQRRIDAYEEALVLADNKKEEKLTERGEIVCSSEGEQKRMKVAFLGGRSLDKSMEKMFPDGECVDFFGSPQDTGPRDSQRLIKALTREGACPSCCVKRRRAIYIVLIVPSSCTLPPRRRL